MQRALDVFELGTLEYVSPTSTGGFDYNQSAFLRTNVGDYVLKGAPRDPWQFPKERFFAELIATRTTLRAPWPYHYYPGSDIFDWSFVIMPRLEGVELNALLPTIERGPEAWKDVARVQSIALVDLQSATFDRAGDFSLTVNGIDPFPGSHAGWVANEIVSRLAKSSSLTAADTQWVTNIVQGWSTSLEPPKQNVIVHGDFGYWNMLFARVGEGLRVTGVYDLVTATIGDNLADVAYQHTQYVGTSRTIADFFVKEYLMLRGRDEESFDERFHLYLVYERLNLRDFAYRNDTDWIDWNTPFREWMYSYYPIDSPFREES